MISAAAVAAETTSAKSTPDAAELVQKALRAEAAGNAIERQALLAAAIKASPDYAPARWHSGQIKLANQWQNLETAQQAAANDPLRNEYHQLRKSCDDSPESQRAIAVWCRKHRLDEESQFHWQKVLASSPNDKEALQAAGLRWFNGQLMSFAAASEAKRAARERRQAAKKHAPDVARWVRQLSAGDVRSRDQALGDIRELRDANVLPTLEKHTLDQELRTNARFERAMLIGLALVDALSEMDAARATESLLRHAALSQVADVRKAACSALQERPMHEYMPQLLGALGSPIESSFRVATTSDGSVHYWHSLYREGQDANCLLEGRSSLFQHDFGGSAYLVDDATRTLVGEDRESDVAVAAKKSQEAVRSQYKFAVQATSIQREVAQANASTAAMNARLFPVLRQATGQDLADSPAGWWDWWDRHNDYVSYAEGERPTYEHRYENNEKRYYREPSYEYVSARHSCFAPGTLVWTKTGPRAIESLEIGDFVLAQEVATGELAYQPVMGRTVRPGRKTVNVRCGDETLQATLGHLMWVSGAGWKMAKELLPGDVLHGAQRPVLVESVEAAETINVYNLIVADWHNYFVGHAGVLVHDNSPRQPTSSVVPGHLRESGN